MALRVGFYWLQSDGCGQLGCREGAALAGEMNCCLLAAQGMCLRHHGRLAQLQIGLRFHCPEVG